MNCKNCNTTLKVSSRFCHVCGGKVITERINTKVLIAEFMLSYVGWDNRFFVTLRAIISKPAEVILTYLDGVRSRYVPPLVFVGLGVALITITYNVFSEEYLELTYSMVDAQFELVQDSYDQGKMSQKQYDAQVENMELNKQIQKYFLKYFNVISFLFLPIYALISRLVFGKRFNYGEHLVINAYLQGLIFFLGIFTFLLAVYVYAPIFIMQLLVLISYYLWTFKTLMNLSIGKTILKFLLFLGILIGLGIFMIIVGVVFTLAKMFLF